MEFIQHWITQYGYVGIFSLLVLGIVGLPVPDETLLTFAGYLVYRGHLHAIPTALSALFGSICGISLSYILGYTTGYYLIHRFGPRVHLTPEKVDRVHRWFRKFGGFTLTFGYFVPAVRHLTAYVAGASKLEYPVFAGFAYAGALLWTGTFLALGYLLGDRWTQGLSQVHSTIVIGACALGGLAVVLLLWKRYRAKRS